MKTNSCLTNIFSLFTDKKYDVAISTATGNSLDTVITDTVETGKKCIEYLKRHDIGRVNALALDKTLNFKDKVYNIPKTPENAPRLIDLIKVEDDAMKTAFYKYVRETLVAENMEQAKRISFGAQRYRVVTLDGEVIETSGAMAGGGKTKMAGKMGTQIKTKKDEVNLEKMEKEVQDKVVELKKVESKLREVEAEMSQTKRELSAREQEAKKLKVEISAFDEEGMKQKIQQQKKVVQEAKPDPKKIKELEKNCADLKRIFEGASEAAAETKSAVNKLNKQIKEIHSTKVKSVQARLDGVRSQIDKFKKEVTRLEVEIKSSERNLKKAKDKVDAFENEVKEAENKLREMNEERSKLEDTGKELIEKVKQLEEQREDISEKCKACKESMAALEEEETKHKSERIEIDQAMEKFALAIKEHTKTISHWKREISKLKLEDIPGQDSETLKEYTNEELKENDPQALQSELNILEENLGSKRPDLKAIGKNLSS